MAQQLVTDIILNLGGNLARKAQQYGSSMAQFARKNQRAMGVIRQSAAAAGRGIDMVGNRYVALGATLVSGAAVTGFAALDRRLSRVAIAADLTKEKTNELYEEIQKVSNQEGIRIDPSEALSAIEEILSKTGDLNYAITNLPNIASVIQATGADGLAIGGIFTEFQKLGINSSKEAMEAIDILNVQGKSGAFRLDQMAAFGPQFVSAYAATGRKGVDAIRELGSVLQVVMKGTGTPEKAVTAFEALIRDITAPDRVKKLKRLGGINVFDPEKLKQGVEVMRPLPELMTEIVEKSKGLSSNLAQLNLTDEAKRALNTIIAEYTQSGDVKAFDQFMAITGDGTTTLKDAKLAANDFAASLQLINNSVKQYANTRLADPVAELAKAINSLEPEAIDRWLSAAGAVAGVGAAVIALRKTYKAGEWIAGGAKKIFGKGGKQDGKGGGFADLGAMPVYVVNMPGSGLGSSPDMDLPESSHKPDKPNKPGSKPFKPKMGNLLKQAGQLTTIGYGISIAPEFSPINIRRSSDVDESEFPKGFKAPPGLLDMLDELRGIIPDAPKARQPEDKTSMQDAVKAFTAIYGDKDHSSFGSGSVFNLNQLPQNQQPLKADLKISVTDDRVKVSHDTVTAPGLNIDYDAGLN